MFTTHQTARATAAGAFALALSVGAATAPAQAAPYLSISSHLTIDREPVAGTNPSVYHTDVQGVVTLSQAAAQDSINHGSIVLLEPQDRNAEQWLEEHVDPEARWWGPALVVEPRYVADIVNGAREDGLEVR